ncbi:hypothetical protein L1887_60188 [Cichorium endivia]|nr:hypothetical protein L1887_60188 [Cichorium endivia]
MMETRGAGGKVQKDRCQSGQSGSQVPNSDSGRGRSPIADEIADRGHERLAGRKNFVCVRISVRPRFLVSHDPDERRAHVLPPAPGKAASICGQAPRKNRHRDGPPPISHSGCSGVLLILSFASLRANASGPREGESCAGHHANLTLGSRWLQPRRPDERVAARYYYTAESTQGLPPKLTRWVGPTAVSPISEPRRRAHAARTRAAAKRPLMQSGRAREIQFDRLRAETRQISHGGRSGRSESHRSHDARNAQPVVGASRCSLNGTRRNQEEIMASEKPPTCCHRQKKEKEKSEAEM